MDKYEILNEVTKWDFAHRGLFDNNLYPENSMIAFKRAVEAGYAIELDVHLTKDDKLLICHDSSLIRMSNTDLNIEDNTLEELKKYTLLNTDEKMPEFSEMLNMVSGRVPLLIELKVVKNAKRLCKFVMNELKDYEGLFVIESFFPGSLRYIRKNYPNIAIGQLSGDLIELTKAKVSLSKYLTNLIMKTLFVNVISKPDFVAFKYEDINRKCFKRFKGYKFSWTIRNIDDYKICHDRNIIPIFEKFNPKVK